MKDESESQALIVTAIWLNFSYDQHDQSFECIWIGTRGNWFICFNFSGAEWPFVGVRTIINIYLNAMVKLNNLLIWLLLYTEQYDWFHIYTL